MPIVFVWMLSALVGSAGTNLIPWPYGLTTFARAYAWSSMTIMACSPHQRRTALDLVRASRLQRHVRITYDFQCLEADPSLNLEVSMLHFLDTENFTMWEKSLCTRPLRCAAVALDINIAESFTDHLRKFDKSRAFYYLRVEGSSVAAFRAQTFRDQDRLVLNPVTLSEEPNQRYMIKKKLCLNVSTFSNCFRRISYDLDLQGATMTSMALSWPPFNTFSDCDSLRRNCSQDGILSDVGNLVANMFNFTLRLDTQPEGFWGRDGDLGLPSNWSFSEENPVPPNGIFGYLVNDMYDMSLVSWRRFLERDMYENTFYIDISLVN